MPYDYILIVHELRFVMFCIIMYFLLKQTSVELIAHQKGNNYSIYNKIHKNDHNYIFVLFKTYCQYS